MVIPWSCCGRVGRPRLLGYGMGWTGRKEGRNDTGWMKRVPLYILYILAGASSARVSFLFPFVLQLHKHVCSYTVGYAVTQWDTQLHKWGMQVTSRIKHSHSSSRIGSYLVRSYCTQKQLVGSFVVECCTGVSYTLRREYRPFNKKPG